MKKNAVCPICKGKMIKKLKNFDDLKKIEKHDSDFLY
jgi:hypothetical protein